MALNKTKESWYNQIFIFFLMVELVLFFLNGDQYFQLSGWYLPLLGALLFGIPSLLKNKYTFLRMLPIILLLVFILGCIVNFLHLDRGYTFSYLMGLAILVEFAIVRLSEKSFNKILYAYVISALVISLLILLVRQRYYDLDSTRLTIQIASNPRIDPNYLAAFLVAPFIIALDKLRDKSTKISQKILLGIMTAIVALGILLTGSRGAYVSVVLGIAVLFISKKILKSKKVWKYTAAVLVLLLIVLLLLPQESKDRFFNIGAWFADRSNLRRFELWGNALKAVLHYPALGYGSVSTATIIGETIGIFEPAHNTLLDLCLQQGLLFLLLFTLICVVIVFNKNKLARSICIATLVTGIFIGSEACFYLWFNLGLALHIVLGEKNEQSKHHRSRIQR